MKKKLIVLGSVLGLTPMLAFAATSTTPAACTGIGAAGTSSGTLVNVLCTIGNILNSIVPILVALGVVFFVWGVITFVIANDEEAKTRGRDRMIYGIIGLAVIVGLWGLVAILGNTFGVNNPTNTITLPTVPITQ
jgi:mannose/fructose/N-acetylgalactosamine-specific phosphotransferase system component IID